MKKTKAKRRLLPAITRELHIVLKRETANIIEAGKLLTEARSKLDHGEFLPWLAREFRLSERSAQNYMCAARFAVKWTKSATVADLLHLAPSALYFLGSRDDDDAMYTPEVIETILAEAKEKRVDEERCREIAESRSSEPAEEPLVEEAPEEDEAVEDDPDEILDGPPPELPPSPPPEPIDLERPHLRAQFGKAVEALLGLRGNTVEKFDGAVSSNDLIMVADFLNAAANRKPSDHDDPSGALRKLKMENLDLKARIAELEACIAELEAAPGEAE